MNAAHHTVLDTLLESAVDGVFSHYGSEVLRITNSDLEHNVSAVIGFSSETLCGGLALGMSSSLARALMPMDGLSEGDWVGELANQLLGRFRNQLLQYEIDIAVGVPVVLNGATIKAIGPRARSPGYVCFAASGHEFSVMLESRTPDNFQLPEPRADAYAVDEGSLILF